MKPILKRARKQLRSLLGIVLPSQDRSAGVIDGLDGLYLRGWFISRAPGRQGNVFTVHLDGKQLGRYEADLPREDLLQLKGVLNCGYVVDLLPALGALPDGLSSLNDGRPHLLTLHSMSGRSVASLEVQREMSVRGALETLSPTGLRGWAIDDAHPGDAVELHLYVDGDRLLTVRTAERRRDLIAKGWGAEQGGFSIAWPAGLFPGSTQLDLRGALDGKSLTRCPTEVTPAALPPPRGPLSYLDHRRDGALRPVTVIVPIYNAVEAVRECLASLEAHLPRDAEVLLLDDASPDPLIPELIEHYRARLGYRSHRNPDNLGYTRSVNKGIALAGTRDVVLLNSDTVVTARWLENLRYCAYSRPRVATATALSDHAGAFSAPEIGEANPIPPHLDADVHARRAVVVGQGRPLEVPTGNGFCLYIRRQALDELGVFDEAKFPRGYGEENDLCMRALRAGWLNLVCDKAYVFHKRSQSFLGEKAALMEAGSNQLQQDYPEYKFLTQRFRDIEFEYVRLRVRKALAAAEAPALDRPRVLYVLSTQTGGTPQTNLDLMQAMRGHYHALLLRCDSRELTLSELGPDGKLRVRELHALSQPIDPVSHRSDEYDRIVLDLLYRHSIALVHIRHIAWHGLGLPAMAKVFGLPVVYSVHDFYSVCPSLNLLDENLKYCGGRCTAGEGTCQIALWPANSLPTLKHRFVHRWHDMFEAFLADCDHVITTAPSAAETFLSTYPSVSDRFSVIPHGRDFPEFGDIAQLPQPGDKLRVLVPGNISASKGARLIKEIAELDVEGRVEFHFLGNIWGGLAQVGVHHGTYERANFAAKVRAIAPHMGIILSIWAETYCHTLTEMWACGVPVAGIDVGAVGDRLRESGGGWLIERDCDAATVLGRLLATMEDAEGYARRIEAVRTWQRGEGHWNTTARMGAEYRHLYRQLLHPGTAPLVRVGLLVKAGRKPTATAEIRMLRPLAAASEGTPYDLRPVDSAWLLAGGAAQLDALVIQRDTVPAADVAPLLERLRDAGLPYTYEIDDLLWDLPADHRDHAIGPAEQIALLDLIRSAQVVTTSTEPLADRLRELNPNVRVVRNSLDRRLWLQPLDPAWVARVAAEAGLADDRPRLLYMGTKSHERDLQLIAPAVTAVMQKMPALQFVQIGGGPALPGAIDLWETARHLPYPEFVRWLRAICTRVTLAAAPLDDTSFNAVKSDIKTLDYGLARVPAVFSAAGPYQAGVEDGRTGVLCANEPGAWYLAITRLLHDEALRTHLREAAFERALGATCKNLVASAWRSVLLPAPRAGLDLNSKSTDAPAILQ